MIRYIEMNDTLATFPPVRFFAGKLDEFQPIGNLPFISHTSAYTDAMRPSVTGPLL